MHAVLAWFLYHAVTVGKRSPVPSAVEGMDIFIDEGWRLLRNGPFADLLDEGLDILTGLWQGQPFSYQGKHYQVQPTDFLPPPPPLQQPRIPIWVVGAWPKPKST